MIPHASNGFFTFSELKKHCAEQQRSCTALIKSEFKIIKTKFQARLDQGDLQFTEIKQALENLAKDKDGPD